MSSDLDRLFKPLTKDDSAATEEVWTTKDGRKIPVKQMEDKHLLNTIRFLVAEEAKLRIVGIDADVGINRELADRFVDLNIKRNQEKRKMLVREAKRRELHEWIKFGLSSTALEILDGSD